MCQDYMDSWKEVAMSQSQAEWAAEDVVTHLSTLESANYGFPTFNDTYRTKVGMLKVRMQRIVEEIEALDPEQDNV